MKLSEFLKLSGQRQDRLKVIQTGDPNTISYQCPHDAPIKVSKDTDEILSMKCPICKDLMALPEISKCKVVCNQGEIMPLMMYYIEAQGMSVRKASERVEDYYHRKYGDESPVTADRARFVWVNRKTRNDGASAPPKSSNTGASQEICHDYTTTQLQEPDMEFDFDWAVSIVLTAAKEIENPVKELKIAIKILEENGYGG